LAHPADFHTGLSHHRDIYLLTFLGCYPASLICLLCCIPFAFMSSPTSSQVHEWLTLDSLNMACKALSVCATWSSWPSCSACVLFEYVDHSTCLFFSVIVLSIVACSSKVLIVVSIRVFQGGSDGGASLPGCLCESASVNDVARLEFFSYITVIWCQKTYSPATEAREVEPDC
jgi:hypothetical protein